ncbi:MAG: DinB family protein [Gemmatimonadota bacterium]
MQFEHLEWADAVIWSIIRGLPQARTDERIQGVLHHMHLVQHLYLQVWKDEPLVMTERSTFADLGEMHAWARRFHAESRRVVSTLTGAELGKVVRFPWEGALTEQFGAVHPATLEESLLQIVLHSTHHRAQVCTRIRELDGEPPLIDFIAWVWQGKPEAPWTASAAPDLSA